MVEHSVKHLKHYVRLVGRVTVGTVLLIGLLNSATGSLSVLEDIIWFVRRKRGTTGERVIACCHRY